MAARWLASGGGEKSCNPKKARPGKANRGKISLPVIVDRYKWKKRGFAFGRDFAYCKISLVTRWQATCILPATGEYERCVGGESGFKAKSQTEFHQGSGFFWLGQLESIILFNRLS